MDEKKGTVAAALWRAGNHGLPISLIWFLHSDPMTGWMQTAPAAPGGLCFPPCLTSRYAGRKSLFWGRSCSYAKRNGASGRISGICLVCCDYVFALFPISFKDAVLHKASAKSDSLSCAYQFFQGPWAAHCLICMADWMAVSACATHCKNA